MLSSGIPVHDGQINRVTDVVRCVVVLDTHCDVLKLIKASGIYIVLTALECNVPAGS